jgi:TolA-binding protein
MSDRYSDFDSEEQEFLRRFGTSAEELVSRARNCPLPEILLAADSGDWPEERRTEIVAHLQSCSACSALVRDLSDPEIADPQPTEAARIRSRVFDRIGAGQEVRWWLRRPLALAAALTLAFVGLLLWYSSSNSSTAESTQTTAVKPEPATPATRETVFRMEKAPVKLPASVLVWRGEGEKYAADLGRAIGFYRDENYGQAAVQFEEVASKYPASLEAHFYLGVCQLLLGRPSEASASLLRARQLDRGSLADDITWYLALVQVKTANTAGALAELRKLCPKAGEYSARACAGVQEIEAE